MRKSIRRTLLVATGIVGVLAVGLATTTVVNAIATATEKDRIESYGQTVSVGDGEMNVVIAGDGDTDIVLLPGFGTASPALDFEPLVSDLAQDHRVIVVEPFGYGLSDGTDRERTTENIVDEVHQALQTLDVDRFVLMGHSIAGLYAIDFANRYPDEVAAFVGIDTSVPGQPNMDAEFPIGLLGAAKNLGLIRLVSAIGGDGLEDGVYADDAPTADVSPQHPERPRPHVPRRDGAHQDELRGCRRHPIPRGPSSPAVRSGRQREQPRLGRAARAPGGGCRGRNSDPSRRRALSASHPFTGDRRRIPGVGDDANPRRRLNRPDAPRRTACIVASPR